MLRTGILVILLSFLQVSCAISSVGDSAVRVKGEIVGLKADESCLLNLHNEKSGDILVSKSVEAAFLETFILPPMEATYFFTVKCDFDSNTFKSNIYTLGDIKHYREPVNLGKVEMLSE